MFHRGEKLMHARCFSALCLALFAIAFFSIEAAAKRMAAAAEAEAAKNICKNKWMMVIAVLDDGGHLINLERMDNA
jgi:heme-degrading protein